MKNVTIGYAKQETLVPLKNLGRYLGAGAAGTLLMGIGLIFISLGILRVLQTETGTRFTGHLSWLPYVLTLIFLGVIIAIAVAAMKRDRSRRGGASS